MPAPCLPAQVIEEKKGEMIDKLNNFISRSGLKWVGLRLVSRSAGGMGARPVAWARRKERCAAGSPTLPWVIHDHAVCICAAPHRRPPPDMHLPKAAILPPKMTPVPAQVGLA